jgi:hypothetical protein
MGVGGVVINFAVQTAEAVRDIGKLTNELDLTDGAVGRMRGSMGKVAGVVGAAAGSMGGAAAAAWNMAQAASEDASESEKLATVLETIPGVTQDMIDANAEWIDGMERATLVSDTDLRTAVSNLALATGDLTQAQDLAKLAVDASTSSGKDLNTVTEALSKAVAGNMSSLIDLFPFLESNKKQLDKNKNGTVDLDEALDGLKDAYEGSAEAAAEKKPWEQIKVVWEQISEELGEQLLPYMEDLAEWLTSPENQDAIKDVVEGFGDFAEKVGELAGKIGKILDPLARIAGIFIDINNAIQSLLDKGNPFKHWRQPPVNSWTYPGESSRSGRSASSRAAGADRAGAQVVMYAPPVHVTEEQVYRAVSRLLVRGEVRHGASRLAVP